MTRATTTTVSRPELWDAIAAFRINQGAYEAAKTALRSVGYQVRNPRRRGLVIEGNGVAVRNTSEPDAEPLTLRAVVELVDGAYADAGRQIAVARRLTIFDAVGAPA